MKKRKEKDNKFADKALDKLIDFVDSDIPYSAFCAVLAKLYWAL